MANRIFKQFSEKGYKQYTENTIEELDELPLDNHHIITEFAHICQWLRVNHNLHIYPSVRQKEDGSGQICYTICGRWLNFPKNKKGFEIDPILYEPRNTPQEAYLTSFSYILNNLI